MFSAQQSYGSKFLHFCEDCGQHSTNSARADIWSHEDLIACKSFVNPSIPENDKHGRKWVWGGLGRGMGREGGGVIVSQYRCETGHNSVRIQLSTCFSKRQNKSIL